MKGLEWGLLYNQFKDTKLDAKKLEKEVAALMEVDDVTRRAGIYSYVLDDDESHLNIRCFSHAMKRGACERQKGKCPKCMGANKTKNWNLDEMHADHIKPWSKGGETAAANCQMLCADCNRRKAGK